MKSKLLLLTGAVALVFVGPINASAARIDIVDSNANEAANPGFIASGFAPANDHTIMEGPGDGLFDFHGHWVAPTPLLPGASQTINFNMNNPADDGPVCCSDTLSITLTGITPVLGDPANMSIDLHFRSGFPEGHQVTSLVNGTLSAENVFFQRGELDLIVTATSDVPGPIVGAGLPGLIAACGALIALARRRRQLVA
jgi:hypothetical protein